MERAQDSLAEPLLDGRADGHRPLRNLLTQRRKRRLARQTRRCVKLSPLHARRVRMDPRALRRRLVEGPGSAGERCRAGRWERFAAAFPAVAKMSVIDLGGTTQSWLRAPV